MGIREFFPVSFAMAEPGRGTPAARHSTQERATPQEAEDEDKTDQGLSRTSDRVKETTRREEAEPAATRTLIVIKLNHAKLVIGNNPKR